MHLHKYEFNLEFYLINTSFLCYLKFRFASYSYHGRVSECSYYYLLQSGRRVDLAKLEYRV